MLGTILLAAMTWIAASCCFVLALARVDKPSPIGRDSGLPAEGSVPRTVRA
jgi:hypothetical protein